MSPASALAASDDAEAEAAEELLEAAAELEAALLDEHPANMQAAKAKTAAATAMNLNFLIESSRSPPNREGPQPPRPLESITLL